jgi:hypothetical protein
MAGVLGVAALAGVGLARGASAPAAQASSCPGARTVVYEDASSTIAAGGLPHFVKRLRGPGGSFMSAVRPFGDLGRIDVAELGPLDPLTDGWTVVAAPPRGSGTFMCRAEVLVVPRRPQSVNAFRRPIVSRDPGGHGLSGPGRFFSGVALGARR